MTVIALALALTATLAVTVVAFTGVIRSLIRQHARERERLIDQVLHLSGKTWSPPPAEATAAADEAESDRRFALVAVPEQDADLWP